MFDADDNNQARLVRSSTEQTSQVLTREVSVGDRTFIASARTKGEMTDFGQIKEITLPEGWVEAPAEKGLSTVTLRMFHPEGKNDISINLYYRGQPLDEDSARTFHNLLSARAGSHAPEKLSPLEIRSLDRAMGYTTVGDNQYTNSARRGDRNYPVFNLATAEVLPVNGRTTLKVTGTFQDQNGMPLNEYCGYFIDADGQGKNVDEIFYQAKTRGKYMLHVKDFENTLKSIQWQ